MIKKYMNMYDKIAKNLQDLVDNSGFPLTKICKDSGVNQSIAYKFLTRTQERITIENLICFANYFNVPISKFWENDDILTFNKDIQNYDETSYRVKDYTYIKFYDVRVSAGSGLPSEAEKFRMLPVEKNFIKVLGYDIKNLNAVIVEGDSMEPTLRNGDRVIICIPSSPMDFVPGVYVIRDVAGLKVKRLDNDKDGSLEVMSDNNYYKTRIYSKEEVEAGSVTIIGRVVGRFGAM